MATENKQTWGRRSKKTSVVALGLVAVLAGVAVAYFLTRQGFEDNLAKGGTLTVDSDLPINLAGQPLYPTNTTGNTPADSAAVATDEFTITNKNTVKATYSIYATCEECLEDPAEIEACTATGNDPKSEACQDLKTRNDKRAQFEQLYVRITRIVPAGQLPSDLGPDPLEPTKREQKYAGRLAAMTPDNPQDLGQIDPDGETAQYDVELWLNNDPNSAQPQGVESDWEFFVNAKTPVG